MPPLNFSINNQSLTANCSPGSSLLSVLRELGWVGVHRVCETGDCGACTVWVEGAPVHSCLYPVMRVENRPITTIEGLATDGALSTMQQAFLEKQGFQCGFCTAGMIMSAAKVNYEQESDLRLAMRGNLCRCTGYAAIIESILHAKASPSPPLPLSPPPPHSPVGKSIPKQDGPDIVTGKPVYTADFTPEGMLHLKLLRSPHPHARIRSIDTTQAKALPGVHLVLTHADVPRLAYTTAGHAEPEPDPADHFMLDTKVRFIGDRVAAVVADSVAIAEQACRLIEVEYDILPHVTDPILAMGKQQDSDPDLSTLSPATATAHPLSPPPILHDEPDCERMCNPQRNLAGYIAFDDGDIDQGFAAADLVLETTYQLPAVQHAHLEPHVCTSWLDETGMLVVRSSTQVPFHCQRVLGKLLDLPQSQIRVYKAKLGGGFGNKQEILCEDLCALATLRTGKPVQWEFSRHEEFIATNSRHAMTIRLKAGVKTDGTLVALDMEAITNTGAYGNHGSTVVFLTGYETLGLYRCPNKRYRGYAVYTNTMPAGAFRGYGATQGCFVMESHLSTMARQLAIDPVPLRLKNMIRPGDTLALGNADDHFNLIGSYALEECFDKVIEAMGYIPGHPPVVEGQRRRGMGIAISMQGSGLSKIHSAGVKLAFTSDGRFCLRTGSVDVGTGSDTTLRQIAAQVLGVTVADIDLVAADTLTTPFDAGSYASATLYISGQSTKQAAEKLRDRLFTLATPLLKTERAALVLNQGMIQAGTEMLSLEKLARLLQQEGELGVRSQELGESDGVCPLVEVENHYAADESTLTFAVQGVEVEVDMETGKVTILRSVQAIDLGTAINPRICEGQAVGGSVMGLGYALSEELLLDDRGKILNPGFRTYRLSTAADVPPTEVFLIEHADPYGPFGGKGVGEITTNCMAPAIANAIAHATGARITQLPMTPERVWAKLNEKALSNHPL